MTTQYLFVPIGDGPHREVLKRLSTITGGREPISVLSVVERAGLWDRMVHPDFVERTQAAARHAWEHQFERWLEIPGVSEAEVTVGVPAEVVVERSFTNEQSWIVLSPGVDPADHAIVDRIVRLAECPVWVLRPSRSKAPRVLAAVHPEPAELDLNLGILSAAAGLADAVDGSLHALAAWELYGEHSLRHSAFVRTSEREFSDLWSGREEITTKNLDELIEVAGLASRCEQHVKHGPPAREIEKAVRSLRANQLIIGSVGRAGLSGALLGNTAEQVLQNIPCSVVVVKPPDFTSPLRTAQHLEVTNA